MSLLSGLFRSGPPLSEDIRHGIAQWKALPSASVRENIDEARFVVLDVETTGLDVYRDRLLSVGLVPVSHNGVDIGGLTEIVLFHESERPDKDNLVVHGITPTESAAGVDTGEALAAVLRLVGNAHPVAFHADFDRLMLTRALRRHLGVRFKSRFLDLAWLLPALYPQVARGLRTLDDWLGYFAIPAPARHRASGDALVTAELLLIALNEARKRNHREIRKLMDLAGDEARLDRLKPH